MVPAAALLLSCTSASPLQPLRPSVAASLQGILDDSARAHHVIGAQAAVRIPGSQAWSGVWGRNGSADPMRADLLIGTGSISKMYTAVAALVLVDRGALHLEDTIGRWFPGTTNVNPAITVRQLLLHTSGLPEYAANPAFQARLVSDTGRAWQPDELVAYIGAPEFAPGAGWNATNTNRLLLRLIVEQESHRTFADFMRREVLGGDRATWVPDGGAPPAAIASQWRLFPTGLAPIDAVWYSTGVQTGLGEIEASASDVAHFGERVFAGGLLSDSIRAEMLQTVPSAHEVPYETGGGLGIREYRFQGRTAYGHSGATAHDRAMLLFDPATGIVVAVSINQGAGHGEAHIPIAWALLQAAIAGAASQ